MSEEKKAATRDLLVGIATHMVGAPFSQIRLPSESVDELRGMLGAADVSDSDLYDAIQRLSQRPCPSEISSFVRAVCDLDAFYLRPDPRTDSAPSKGKATP